MNFRTILFKNFKYNIKSHIALIWCCIFVTSVINIYANLLNNDYLGKDNDIKNMVIALFAVLIVFSFVFMRYVFNSYIQSRSKEFALYLSLGINKKNIKKLINGENIIIAFIATFLGIIGGHIIGIMLNFITSSNEYLKVLDFTSTLNGLTVTLIIMIIYYLMIIVTSSIYINKNQLIQLFKKEQDYHECKKASRITLLIPLVLFVLSYVLMYIKITYGLSNILAVIALFTFLISSYFVISRLGVYIVSIFKKRKDSYYTRLPIIMDLVYKFKQYKKMLYLIAIGNGCAIFVVSFLFGVYFSEKASIEVRNPYDLAIYNIGEDSNNDIDKLITEYSKDIERSKEFEFLLDIESKDFIFSQNTANNILGNNYDIKPDNIVIVGKVMKNAKIIEKTIGDYKFNVQQVIYGELSNDLTFSYVLSNSDYEKLSNKKYIKYHAKTYTFNEQSKAKSIELAAKIKESYKNSETIVCSRQKELANSDLIYFNMAFLLMIVAIIFFLCSGAIIYFQLFSNLDFDKKKFVKLSAVGMTKKEFAKNISRELSILFIIPLVMGSLGAFSWLIIIRFNENSVYIEAFYAGLLIIIYTLIQSMFYVLSKRKYVKRIQQ